MQDMLAFFNANVGVIKGSLRDTAFLSCLLLSLIAGATLSWSGGAIAIVLLAIVRVGLADWQQFSPGVPPSPNLIYVFSGMFFAAISVFIAIKLLRALWRTARRKGVI
ncbi:MAG: hypothetical protein JWM58_1833 [Rhizobium sp.]|nr:hypothetical protein [Rhizobium sp.]